MLRAADHATDQHVSPEAETHQRRSDGQVLRNLVQGAMRSHVQHDPRAYGESHDAHESEGKAHPPKS